MVGGISLPETDRPQNNEPPRCATLCDRVVFYLATYLEMKSFKAFITELTTTGAITYSATGFGFSVDGAVGDIDVEDYGDADDKPSKPWEIQNAIDANKRRTIVKKFLKKAGANSKKSFNSKSLEPIPDWQSFKR